MPEQGQLRVHGQGAIEVRFILEYLADLKFAYEAALVFETTINRMRRLGRDPRFAPWFVLTEQLWLPVPTKRGVRVVTAWPPQPDDVAAAVPISERLILKGVKLSSPGSWDFLGALNPLEVLRQYLNDRHERRKDLEYRESAEERRLRLENMSLENKVLAERIQIAKDLGATPRDLAPLLNGLIFDPLERLDRHQDRGVIADSEMIEKDG